MDRFRKTTVILMVAAIVIMSCAIAAQAYVYVGSSDWTENRNSYDGHTFANGVYSGNFQISWNISYDTNDKEYDYYYHISGVPADSQLPKDLVHLFWIVSPKFAIIGTPPSGSSLTTINFWQNDIKVLYFPGMVNTYTFTVSFSSLSAPVWGSFYAMGNGSPPEPVAHNGAFFTDYVNLDGFMPTGGNKLDYIPVPGDPVPVPPAVLLFGSGLLGLGALRRFRKG
jgi:hypothetical protein